MKTHLFLYKEKEGFWVEGFKRFDPARTEVASISMTFLGVLFSSWCICFRKYKKLFWVRHHSSEWHIQKKCSAIRQQKFIWSWKLKLSGFKPEAVPIPNIIMVSFLKECHTPVTKGKIIPKKSCGPDNLLYKCIRSSFLACQKEQLPSSLTLFFGENYWSLAVYVSSWIIMDQSFTTL